MAVDVIFSPQSEGPQMGTLTATADGGLMNAINLTSPGFTLAGMDVTPDAGLNFGIIQTGTSSGKMVATVTNTGGQTAASLSKGESCAVDIRFTPTSVGQKTGLLKVTAENAENNSLLLKIGNQAWIALRRQRMVLSARQFR